MAKVLSPLHSVDAKGSIGGLTYSIWKGLNTVRSKQKSVARHATVQPFMRSLLGFLSRQWGLLTDVQRALWEAYAVEHPYPDGFGGTFILSGIQIYVALNHPSLRLFGPAAQQAEPPLIDPPATMREFTAATGGGNPGDIDLAWFHFGAPVGTDKNEIWISPPLGSEGKVNVDSRMRYLSNVVGNVLVFVASGLVEGAWYWFKARYIDEFGQKTAWQWGHATPMLTP